MPMIATLEKVLGVKLPPADKLDTTEANALLSELCVKHEVNLLFFVPALFYLCGSVCGVGKERL